MNNTELQHAVRQELTADQSFDGGDIKIMASAGNLWLTGSVATSEEKALAYRAVQRVVGVRTVSDHLLVRS